VTRRKFTRIFIVSVIPLLLVGFIFSKTVATYDPYAYITCAPFQLSGITLDENCRSVGGPEGSLYKSVHSEHPSWFDIMEPHYNPNASLHNFITGSQRLVSQIKIVDASPFFGYGEDVSQYMKSLTGKRAVLQLGIPNKERSVMPSNGVGSLYCNNLSFEDTPGLYMSQCYGNGWGGPIRYRVSELDRPKLDKLKSSIDNVINERNNDFLIYKIIVYPLFVYIFLMLSGLIWLIRKAVRFVNSE
jgi:hypothetical protein